jgi:hypothetical protein
MFVYIVKKYRTFIGFKDCNGYNMTLGGEGWTGRGKLIDVYDKDLNFITTYESIEIASRELKLYPQNISAVINGRAKATGGYVFCVSGLEPVEFVNITETKIDVYSLDGKFIKTFSTMRDAAKFIGTNPTNVFDCCNQKQLKCKNYITVYCGDKVEIRK